MARTKKKQPQVNHQKPIIWHVFTNNVAYEEELFLNIKGVRTTAAYQIGGSTNTLVYQETEISTTGFVGNSIVALGNYKLDKNNKMNPRRLKALNSAESP